MSPTGSSLRSVVVALLVSGLMPTEAQPATKDVIPLPRKITRLDGTLTLSQDRPLRIMLSGWKCEACKAGAQRFATELKAHGVSITQDAGADCVTLYMGCPEKRPELAKHCRQADAMPDPNWGPEGYRLKITPRTIILAGNCQNGTYYGLQTLRQMVEPIAGGKSVQLECVDVCDWPAMRWRGTMFGLESPAEHARLAHYKMNLINWEVNEIPAYQTIPEFAGGPPLSHCREVAESAARYYVNLTLETQSFGHVSWMLKRFPKLRAHPDNTHVLRPLYEPTYELIGRIYAELCPLYKTPIYHAGCDEAWGIEEWAKKQGLNVDEVIGKHIQHLADMLRKHKKRTMIWGDYLLKHRGAIRWMNPKDFIIGDWHYEPATQYPSVDFFVKNGFETVVSPAVMPARPIFPDYERQIPNIRNFIQDGLRRGAVGLLNTNWPVSPMPTECYWYGWICGAEYAWNPTGRSQAEFDRVFFKQVYGLSAEQGLDLFRRFARLAAYHQLDRQAAKAPKTMLGEAVRAGWQLVVPKMKIAHGAHLREARTALDAAMKAASPAGAARLQEFRLIIDRIEPLGAYLEKTQALGHAIAETAQYGMEGSTDSRLADARTLRQTSRTCLDLIQRSPGLPNRDAARAMAALIRDEANRDPMDGIPHILTRLGLKTEAPKPTIRIKPGTCFTVMSDPAKVPTPHGRREGWCHFPRRDAAASWQFEIRKAGRYRLVALLRHSAGIWQGNRFVKGGRNAVYVGRYGWKLDGKDIKETWIGQELNPDADEAFQWAVLADRQFDAGTHTLFAHPTGINHAIVAEFVFTQDPDFKPETKRADVKMK